MNSLTTLSCTNGGGAAGERGHADECWHRKRKCICAVEFGEKARNVEQFAVGLSRLTDFRSVRS